MKLLELYEDLFQYLCCLNRISKTNAHPEYASVREEIKSRLERVIEGASSDVRLLNQVKRLELPVVFAVDYIIAFSRLKFAGLWAENRLATARNELAGDERFFDFLDADLNAQGAELEEASERLAVYYVLLGLGFRGMYHNQPERIRSYMDNIFPRVRQHIDSDIRSKVSEDAYKYTDTRVLTEPPSNKILFVAIAFVFVSLSVLVVYYALYAKAVDDLSRSVTAIVQPQTDANAK
jgi:type VI protein secretion system component VasF